MRTTILLIVLTTLFLSCHEKKAEFGYGGNDATADLVAEEVKEETSITGFDPQQALRKLIKTADLAWQSKDLAESRSNIEKAAAANRAFIVSDKSTSQYGRNELTFTLRVPSDRFDKLVGDLSEGVSYFDRREIQVEDVTSEYVDTDARIKTKKEVEESYRALLGKAKTIEEILTIERELGNIRAEIEGLQARLNYLASQSSMSTVNISVYEYAAVPSDSFGGKLMDAIKSGWKSLLGLLLFLAEIWPTLLILAGLTYLLRRWWKRKNK